MDPNLDIDPALLAEFIDESLDMLQGLDALFVELEEHPTEYEPVQAIFRPIHSIKGNSAFFGLPKVKGLAHELETLLDLVRKKALGVSRNLIDVLLEGIDELRAMIERARTESPEVLDPAAFDALVQKVKAAASVEAAAPEIVAGVLAQLEYMKAAAPEALHANLDAVIAALEPLAPRQAAPETSAAAKDLPEPVRTIQAILAEPLEGELPDDDVAKISGALDALPAAAATDSAQAAVKELRENFALFVNSVGFDSLLREMILDKLKDISEEKGWAASGQTAQEAPAKDADKAASQPQAPAAKTEDKHAADKTMRVQESYIDTFLAHVGELLVVGDMFSHIQARLAGEDVDGDLVTSFRRANETFGTLSNNLQKSIMSIRKVSVRPLLQKVPRLVRDIASSSGKEIAVELEGQEVEVDKSHIDLLDAPLTHMVRNAADHGIEMPDAREAAGKPRKGAILVSVTATPDAILLRVQDDGAGLNYDGIRKKAESMGLIRPGQQLTQDAVVNLLFSSGVSTAKAVTDVSGRGVGMDVVKRMLDEAGGAITVESEAGKGSSFTVRLPTSVTTQILPGFLVEAAGQCYVLPMDNVHETARIERGEINTVADKGQCVVFHGEVLTVIALRDVLDLPRDETAHDHVIMVTIELRHARYALLVDDVVGVQQVVLREIDGITTGSSIIAGGALMGDGSVALICSPERIYDERNANS